MIKVEPARLREPAAWIMLAVVCSGVLFGLLTFVTGGSGEPFGLVSGTVLQTLSSATRAALAVGAVVLTTRFGAPTPRSRLIGLIAAGSLAIAVAFGLLGAVLMLFGELSFGSKILVLLTALPEIALMAVAAVYVLSTLAPAVAKPARVQGRNEEPFFGGYQNDGFQGYGSYPSPEPNGAPVPAGPVQDPSVPSALSAAPHQQHPAQPGLVYDDPADRTQDAYAAPVYDQGYASRHEVVQPSGNGFGEPYRPPVNAAPQQAPQQAPPQGPVFDQHGYAGDSPSFPPVTYNEPTYSETTYNAPVYNEPVYQEPVYNEPVYQNPAAYPANQSNYGGSPFSGYSGPQFAQQAYEPSYEGDLREQQLAQAYQQAQSYQQAPTAPQQPQPVQQQPVQQALPQAVQQPAQPVYNSPLGHPQTREPYQQDRFQGDPLNGPEQTIRYGGDPLSSPDLSRYQGDPLSSPDLGRYLGDPLSGPERARYQGDPLNDPLPGNELLDPTAIYKPERQQAKPEEGVSREQAAQGADGNPHWYGSDRRDH
ncbi:hypothetical protein [Acrocarpospora macrocephala]|uniref:hypothetical protein n=1 Tax=Acrocarpospora macrocephala TaxID=150177 RepID=UPI0012D2B251|nr:hypothetical protein [Acrocarpospora macrocephala]